MEENELHRTTFGAQYLSSRGELHIRPELPSGAQPDISELEDNQLYIGGTYLPSKSAVLIRGEPLLGFTTSHVDPNLPIVSRLSTDQVADDEPEARGAYSQVEDDLSKASSPQIKDARFWILFIACCVCEFIRAIDATVTPILAPAISLDLRITVSAIYLSGSGFLLAQSVIEPLFAALNDAIGRKICILLALGVFGLASVLTALSRNAAWLVVARAIQGLGAGGIDIAVSMILVDIVELKERSQYNAYCQLSGAAGLLLGTLIASGIASTASWRWTFWINIPLVVPLFLVFAIFFRPRAQRTGFFVSLRHVDWMGLLLLTGSSVALLYAAFKDWHASLTKAALAIGIVTLFLFPVWEEVVDRYLPSIQPVFPKRLFPSRTAVGGYCLALLQGVIGANFQYFFMTYLYVSKSLSLVHATVVVIPSTTFILTTAAGIGFLTTKLRVFKPFTVLGFAVLAPVFILLGTVDESTKIAVLVVYQCLLGIATGLTFPGRLLAIFVAQKDPADEAKAAAVGQFLFNMGFCFGIPIGLMIFDQRMGRLLDQAVSQGLIGPGDVIPGSDIGGNLDLLARLPPDVQSFYRHSVAISSGEIWRVMAGISYAALLVSVCTKNLRIKE